MAAQEQFLPATTAAPDVRDLEKRIADLDSEGIWSESVFPSLGTWSGSFLDSGAVALSDAGIQRLVQKNNYQLIIAANSHNTSVKY
ncbi:hypothetical protein JK2ML_0947 [Mycobacterium leprae Kyoto-2]|uniref:Uncharacterized protein n=3 Tax=Mycobacterium leprae TaxID=1769 RepID=Q9CCD2_MYCLE|nr:hypothetical protein [Mycobacterium leprae]OAR20724.1 hypothetical protein A8144_09565 [Mycobacterium leprae 3125609]CAR71042.1 hypothetical protein MLBr00947 [Mycobacterium leprae Br4923]AWV47677.1 hypothetical protein DIJ64_05085 [Mycobacterium leprae]OAX70883.1 hypothetical protein A3216_09210 [Mycobacterium leprae 7935681]CAC31328.1 hypothetical protein [Mycobacterium leprae]